MNVNSFWSSNFELVTFTSPVITHWYLWSLWMVKKKSPNRFAFLITWILADLARDITAPPSERKRFNEKDINWKYQLTSGEHQCPCATERPQMIKYHVGYFFIFSQSLIPNLDSLVGFYRAMTQVHHLDISPGNYSSRPGRVCASSFPASSILNHNPHLWFQPLKPDLRLRLPTSCLPRAHVYWWKKNATWRATKLFGIQLPRRHLWKREVDNEAFLFRWLKLISEFNWNFRNVLFRSKKI